MFDVYYVKGGVRRKVRNVKKHLLKCLSDDRLLTNTLIEVNLDKLEMVVHCRRDDTRQGLDRC